MESEDEEPYGTGRVETTGFAGAALTVTPIGSVDTGLAQYGQTRASAGISREQMGQVCSERPPRVSGRLELRLIEYREALGKQILDVDQSHQAIRIVHHRKFVDGVLAH